MIALTIKIIEKEHDIEWINMSIHKFNERCKLYSFRATTIHLKAFSNCINAATRVYNQTIKGKTEKISKFLETKNEHHKAPVGPWNS